MKFFVKNMVLALLLILLPATAFSATLPQLVISGYKVIASGGSANTGVTPRWVILQKGRGFKLCDIYSNGGSDCLDMK